MTNYEKFFYMNKKELAKYLATYIEYDGSPWANWFEREYCSKCPRVHIMYEGWIRPQLGSYCEKYDKCVYFPDLDHVITIEEEIEIWLELEENGEDLIET